MNQIAGQPLSLAIVLADMLRFAPAALVYSLLIGLPAALGTTMLFLPGILVASLFALVVPTSVGEAVGIFTALRRGVLLGGKVFGRLLLIVIASGAVMVMVVALRVYGLDQFLPGSGLGMFATRFGVMYVPALFVLLLANITFTLLYLEAHGVEMSAPASPISSGAVGGRNDLD